MLISGQRALLPESYQSFDTEHSTPLNCVDCLPLSFPLEPFRKMIKVDEASRSVTREVDENLFWDENVKDVAEAWKSQDVRNYRLRASSVAFFDTLFFPQRSHDAFKFRAAVFTHMSSSPSVDLSRLQNSAPALTSLGDLTRLNLLEQFRPSPEGRTLTVEEIDYTNRYTQPSWSWCFLEYDGVFRLKCNTGEKYSTQEQLDECAAVAKEWFDSIFNA